jgi:transposase-like protein
MITQPKRLRVNMGLQCPECHGVNIQTPERQSYQCQDCGCQWDHRYYPSLKVPDAQKRLHVNMGLQCPECHGVNIQTPERQSYQCQDCGCQWDRRYYPSLKVED